MRNVAQKKHLADLARYFRLAAQVGFEPTTS